MLITDRDAKRAAMVSIFTPVTAIKLTCSPRCAYQYIDNPETQKITAKYDAGEILPVAHKDFMRAYSILISRSKDLQAGRVGGVL